MKGLLINICFEDLGVFVVKEVVVCVIGLDFVDVDDVILGCAMFEGE